MKLESLEKFMTSKLNEEFMSNVYGGKVAPIISSTAGGEICVSDAGAGGSNTGCLSYSSDFQFEHGGIVYNNIKDVDKQC